MKITVKKNCNHKGAISFNGGIGISYSIKNRAKFRIEGKYHYISDIKIPYTQGETATINVTATSVAQDAVLLMPSIDTIGNKLDKNAYLKLSPSYFIISGNFSIAF
ncbi:MAG: hypothetical protein OEY79_02080 [Anaplasmataceae bacterium]|nr:hypothetical protein [Anaplasmataceae bacterium]